MTTQTRSHKQTGSSITESLLHRTLGAIERGTLVLADGDQEHLYGQGWPRVRIQVHRSSFYRRVVFGGSVGAGESYMDGDWDCDNLTALVQLMVLNQQTQNRLDGIKVAWQAALDRARHMLRRNSRAGSSRNIGAHYDLSNALFEQFLDPRMMYSAAVYESETDTLESASTAKLERLCRKLQLRPDDHLLEIGTGWGGLAIYAAERYGCRVTTTTISREQYEHAKGLVERRGLSDQVQILLKDYRDLTGQFDKLVSIEMVEAVGHQYLDEYFATCSRLLKPTGLMALQAITIRDRRYKSALHAVDFIKKHIFPGSFIPSVSVLINGVVDNSDAVLVSLEDIGQDYARTLAHWRERMELNSDSLRHLGFDERFLRMWRFYLSYCEGGFLERSISDVQLLFAMPDHRGPVWRAGLGT